MSVPDLQEVTWLFTPPFIHLLSKSIPLTINTDFKIATALNFPGSLLSICEVKSLCDSKEYFRIFFVRTNQFLIN